MALPVVIPNTFANANASIPLSQLDNNFSTVAVAINGMANGAEALANVNITGGSIANASLSNVSISSGNVTINVANVTTLDATNVEVTNIKAKDGAASATIANSTGVMTIGSSVLTTTDINGGTIDGTAIGGTTPAAGAFTTLSATKATSGDVATFTTGTVGSESLYVYVDANTAALFNTAAAGAGRNGIQLNPTNVIVDINAATIGNFSSTGLAVTGTISSTGNLTVTGGTITTGSATALSLATSGGVHLKTPNATAVDYTNIQGSTGDVLFYPDGTSTDVNVNIYSKGSAAIKFYSNSASPLEQVRITHTASANRYITLTGSNGGNPAISVSAGSLAIGASIEVAGAIAATANISITDAGATTRIYSVTNSAGSVELGVFASGVGYVGTITNDNFEFYRNSLRVGYFSADGLNIAGYIEGGEQTAPAAPAANGYRIYAEDNGSGKTRLMVKFATGAAQQLALEP